MSAADRLASVLKEGDAINIRARVRRICEYEGGLISVVAWVDNPQNLGFQQICVPIEVVYLLAEEIPPPPIDGGGQIDRLTARLLNLPLPSASDDDLPTTANRP